nr:indolepyruvate ferredoxin oxidoreductase subunit alpha [Candidatus Njordarchaeum guaymaensis]
MSHKYVDIIINSPRKKTLLLGNEAIARGAIEAGVQVAAVYPGTPASEIGDTLASVSKDADLYFEFSVNEKVALEVAAGAAFINMRAMTAMKHVGLNVASDAFMSLAYSGVRGGLVLVSADDPECFSSQNEQDNRYFALFGYWPALEPSNPQECKDFTKKAFDLSERFELPIMIHTVTRISHSRGEVTLGPIKEGRNKANYVKDTSRFALMPTNARKRRSVLLRKFDEVKKYSEETRLTRILNGDAREKTAIVTSGVSFNYVMDSLNILGLRLPVMKIGMINPLPEKRLKNFLSQFERIVVVEELESFLETQIAALASHEGIELKVFGKHSGHIPVEGELSVGKVAKAISKIVGKPLPASLAEIEGRSTDASKLLPLRPPILCPGCPHRASFYAIKMATGGKAIYSSDIGCYSLGILPPQEVVDNLICMGSGVGLSNGISHFVDRSVIVTVGDSTFFHASIPGLINAVYNGAKFVLIVLDNLVTAMTGHQPNPAAGVSASGEKAKIILIEDIAKACGVENVVVVDPFNVKETRKAIREASERGELSVIVARQACTLQAVAERRRKGEYVPTYVIDPEACKDCGVCYKIFACPAISKSNEKQKPEIDQLLCLGCGVCATLCPYKTIKPQRKEAAAKNERL